MSLATRCTHCGTIFKVVQDQLKVSEGWVRCGRCHEVFNALPSLFDLEKDPPPPRPAHLQQVPPPASQPTETGPESPAPAAGSQPFAAAAGVSIPLSAMPDLRRPEAAGTPPAASAPRRDLPAGGLLADPEVDLGFDSTPPSGWERTQPVDMGAQDLDESALALDPAPIEATTDFELDTSIAVDDNTPLEAVLASVAPRGPGRPGAAEPPAASSLAMPAPTAPGLAAPPRPQDDLALRPRPWLDAPPSEHLPSTEEEDALDSRYLMPSASRDRKPPRRLEEGPEFADAQFPSDAFLDAEEDWASDFGPSALESDAPTTAPAPLEAVGKGKAFGGLRPPPSPSDEEPAASANHAEAATVDAVGGAEPDERAALQPEEAGSHHQPEFLKRAHRKAFWRHPATRAALTLVLLVLTAVLALQVAHRFRDLLAAYQPAARPWLARWCEAVGCEIKAPLRIEDLQVESATLVRAASEGPDSYRLAVVIHNRAAVGLAWPHVDLTLTDENGAVIARRVFSPQDAQWLDTADPKAEAPSDGQRATAAPVPPAAPDLRSTTLQWRLQAPGIQPAGYTAELFYP